MASILSIQTGRIAPLGPGRVPSGFDKHPITGAAGIGPGGLDGDEQADLAVHGGPDKAVYAYAAESYAAWRLSHPRHQALWRPGAVGENLTTRGLSEDELCIGDTLRVGGAVLQITQPREPCFKLALRFADSRLPKAMVQNGRSGWYCRVIAPGSVAAGDAVELTARPNPQWTVSRMNRFIYSKQPSAAERAELAALAGLARNWARRLQPPPANYRLT